MGDAIHFLERLKRVERPEVEMAMALYNDPGLTGYVLASLKLPEGAERVALSLEDPLEGPFLVVTRGGQFVTCLGRGMSPHPNPVVTRERLDALIDQVEGIRQRLLDSREVIGPGGRVGALFDELFRVGPDLSREHFKALEAWQPMLQEEYLQTMSRLWSYWHDTILLLTTRKARRAARLKTKLGNHAAYKAFWDGTWAMHHLGNLVAMSDKWFLDSLPPDSRDLMFRMMAWIGLRSGSTRRVLLDLWSVARLGKSALSVQKEAYRGAQSVQQYMCWALGLVALGLRHRSMRAEIRKFLHTPPLPDKIVDRAVTGYHEAAIPIYERLFENTAHYVQSNTLMGMDVWKHIQENEGIELDSDTIPEDVAAVMPTFFAGDFRRDAKSMAFMYQSLTWVATSPAEALYLPQEYLSLVASPWSIEDTLMLMDNHFQHNMEGGNTIQYSKKIGRNDLCSCGSGKKYKRCCCRR